MKIPTMFETIRRPTLGVAIRCAAFVAATLLLAAPALVMAQVEPEVFATGLVAPQGIVVDDQGRIWVAEQGTGNSDGRISVVLPNGQVHPFLTDMPSNIVQGQPESAHHLLFHDGMLWATLGLGEESPDGRLLGIDTTDFAPGDPPLSLDDVEVDEDVASFVLDQDFDDDTDQTNIYNMTIGPDGDLIIVDASANAVLRRTSDTGTLSVVASLPRVTNPTPVGPPMTQAVPTAVIYMDDLLFVTSLPGFPFVENTGLIYQVDLEGEVSVFHEGFTTAVDLVLDPDGNFVVAQFGGFDPASGFIPNTGSIVRLTEGNTEQLTTDLNFPAGIDFASNGDLYIAAFGDGQLLRVEGSAIGTATEPNESIPATFMLLHNYPNPFNPYTTIEYELTRPSHVELTVHNVLGQGIQTLVDEVKLPGAYSARWDGTDGANRALPSGVYNYRMRAGDQVESRTMHLIK